MSAGHLGQHKTLARVRQRFYWHGLKNDVIGWCNSCDACATRKGPIRRGRAKLQQFPVGCPLERVALDILGPLPRSQAGNRYILIVADYFTRWTEAFAIPNQEACTIAEKFVKEFICRFCAPFKSSQIRAGSLSPSFSKSYAPCSRLTKLGQAAFTHRLMGL